mmetsp:Transcript_97961/g.299413  ORF Transcript_97961/g.299413 Transcript_97961/m.299413 type:complete len:200 (-) Transcript_97961:366-965(-)
MIFVDDFENGLPAIWKMQNGSDLPLVSAGGRPVELWIVTCNLGGGEGRPFTDTRTFNVGLRPRGASLATICNGTLARKPPGRWKSALERTPLHISSALSPLSQSYMEKTKLSPSSYPYLSVKSSPHHGCSVFSHTLVVDFDHFFSSTILPVASVRQHITAQKGSALPLASDGGRSLAPIIVISRGDSRGKSAGYRPLMW